MTSRAKLLLMAAMLVPGLVACGGTVDDAGKATETSAAPVKLFDPCTAIADDALTAVGVNPATKESGVAGVHQSGWEICGWMGPKYALTVYSTGRPVAEFESKPGNVDFQDVVIAGRKGRQYRVEGGSKDLTCDVVFPASQGTVAFTISNRASLDNPENPCKILARVGGTIVPLLPT